MLTRRFFTSCALCAALGAETEAHAEGAPTFTRKVLQQVDGPAGYVVVVVEVAIQPGAVIAWHTHPGVESSYVVAGSAELMVKDQPSRPLAAGAGFQIPPETPHAVRNGSGPTTIASTYIVEKGKPLASPAAAPS